MVWRAISEKRGELGCQVTIGPGQLLFSSPFIVRFFPGRHLLNETGARLAFALPGNWTTTITKGKRCKGGIPPLYTALIITWITYLPAFNAALARVRQLGKMV